MIFKLTIIDRIINLIFNCSNSREFEEYSAYLLNLRERSGSRFMWKYAKTVRLCVTRYICGKPLLTNKADVSTNKGWPNCISHLKRYADSGSVVDKRYLLTILQVSKVIGPKKGEKYTSDFSSIVGDYTGKQYFIPRYFIEIFLRKFSITKFTNSFSDKDWILSTKKGPQGISILNFRNSASLLPSHIIESFTYFLSSKALKILRVLKDDYKPFLINPFVGKIVELFEAEGKVRVIAMVDYWTQLALKPLHSHIFSILKRIPMDRTFTQNPFYDWKEDDNKFWSLDLSSATDRFPLMIQKKLLVSIMGYDAAEAWGTILTEREYLFDSKPTSSFVSYSVGQPMGAYSSWAVFALTHHLVVQWAAAKCGFKHFTDYILLGDDIVIKNDRVARVYINLMTTWGVEISESKTHISKHTYEFAKRWISHSKEITPLPLKGIGENFKDIHTVYSIIFEWTCKQCFWISPLTLLQVMIRSYQFAYFTNRYRLINGKVFFKNTFIYYPKVIMSMLKDFCVALRYRKGLATDQELRQYVIKKFSKLDNPFVSVELPNTNGIREFIHGIVSEGLRNPLINLNNSIMDLHNQLSLKKDNSKLEVPLPTNFSALYLAIYNRLLFIRESLQLYNRDTEPSLFYEAIIIPNIADIRKGRRDVIENVRGFARIWEKSFQAYFDVQMASMMPSTNIQSTWMQTSEMSDDAESTWYSTFSVNINAEIRHLQSQILLSDFGDTYDLSSNLDLEPPWSNLNNWTSDRVKLLPST